MPVKLSEQKRLRDDEEQVEYDGDFTDAPRQEHTHDPGHAGDGRGAEVCLARECDTDGHGEDAGQKHYAARQKMLFMHR